MFEMKRMTVDHERFSYCFSFDIDDFIGDGVYWLQIYDESRNLVYDRPFAWCMSMYHLDEKDIRREVRNTIIHEFFRRVGVDL